MWESVTVLATLSSVAFISSRQGEIFMRLRCHVAGKKYSRYFHSKCMFSVIIAHSTVRNYRHA